MLTVGMLEYWNDGVMGSAEMGQRFIGQISSEMENDNLIEKEFPFNPPKHYGGLKSTFQYSIIPCEKRNVRTYKLGLISESYGISQTSN